VPLLEFECERDQVVIEEIRRIGELDPPSCPVCKERMERIFSAPTVIDKSKVSEKLRKRSEEQGKKFFNGYPQHQELVTKTLNSKP